MNVHYGLPTYNQPGLLRRAIEAALKSDIELAGITVVDLSPEHYAQDVLSGLNGVTVLTMPENIGLGATWNLLYALHHDYLVIGNDDVIVEPGTLRAMVTAAEQSPEALFFGFKDEFSFFLLKKLAYLQAGPFDPAFWPIYWEDACMGYRLRLLGYTPVVVPSARFEHEHSRSLNSLEGAATSMFWKRFRRNQAYYEAKWGGPLKQETYTRPFNGEPPSVPPFVESAAFRGPARTAMNQEPKMIETQGIEAQSTAPVPPSAALGRGAGPVRGDHSGNGAPVMPETSCVVRARDFRQPWFAERARELCQPLVMHRKLWEFCSIAQVCHGHMPADARALGFGVGLEPLAAWLASRGATVVATDRPDETAEWDNTQQHAVSLDQLRYPGVCPEREFEARVRFLPLDMNAIPDGLCRGEFDITWSAGSFEHIGGIDRSIDFYCRQMACLRPGGLALHTTEFNMFSYEPTLDGDNLVLFRVQELQVLAERLAAQGDSLWPLDLASGIEPDDLHIDSPPHGLPHLKLAVGSFVTTSVLLVARKGGA